MTDPAPIPKKPFTALDHYNLAAKSMQQIAEDLEREDFTHDDLTMLLDVANAHSLLGLLKINIDKARWEGKMA